MSLTHWQLRREPFRRGYRPASFFPSLDHEEGLARLLFLVEERRSLGILSAAGGMGKTFLLRMLESRLQRYDVDVVSLNLTGLDGHETTWRFAEALGLDPSADVALLPLWMRVIDHLQGMGSTDRQIVILLDHFDQSDDSSIPAIRRLFAACRDAGLSATWIIAARFLPHGRQAQWIPDQADLRIDLQPWSSTCCTEFLEDALVRAGAKRPIFRPSAMERLHEHSQGIPLELLRLADLCLTAGAAEYAELIDSTVVDQVAGELLPEPVRPSARPAHAFHD